MVKINAIRSADLSRVFDVFERCFPDYAPLSPSLQKFLNDTVKWRISIKAVQDGQIIGFYLLGQRKISLAIREENAVPTEDLARYDSLCGIEGVALGVIPEFRKMGVTEQMKQRVRTIPGTDYIYGMQYKSLANLHYWLHTRRLVAESFTAEPVYFTLEDVSLRAKSGLASL